MAAPKTTPPTTSTPTLSAESIADTGASLTRLVVATIPLSLRAVNTISASLSSLLSSVTTSLDGAALPQASGDLGKAANDLVNATAGLHLGLVKAAVQSLDAAVRTVNTAVTESGAPPRK
jgi:hypothetical protein